MANYIEEYSLKNTKNFTTVTSRYITSNILLYGNDKKITYETYKRKKYSYNDSDRFFQINAGLEYRPDLVSNTIYGLPDYWWLLMEYNNMKDITEFSNGTFIRIPKLSEVI
jgi:hypothetical protein